jgi:hypothetical protein
MAAQKWPHRAVKRLHPQDLELTREVKEIRLGSLSSICYDTVDDYLTGLHPTPNLLRCTLE